MASNKPGPRLELQATVLIAVRASSGGGSSGGATTAVVGTGGSSGSGSSSAAVMGELRVVSAGPVVLPTGNINLSMPIRIKFAIFDWTHPSRGGQQPGHCGDSVEPAC